MYKCLIHDKRLQFCRDYPLNRDPTEWLEGCGYKTEGRCRICGKCCRIPREDGEPEGKFDPVEGKPCRYLEET